MQQTFDAFVPTKGSRGALAITRALVAARFGGPRLLVLHGPTGVGKTHLLRAASAEAARQPGWPVCAMTASDLVREIVGDTPRRAGAEVGLLTLDDLHTLAPLPMCQQEVGRLLEHCIRAGHTVLAAAGVPLADLASLVGRLQRIEGAEFVEVKPPDPREMARLLLALAARAGIRLGAAAAARLAVRCRGDVRLAQGAIARRRLLESTSGREVAAWE